MLRFQLSMTSGAKKSLDTSLDAQYDERDIRHFEPPRHFEQGEKSYKI